MYVGEIWEISVVNILDRGVSNQERIAFYINQQINIGQYGVFLGIKHFDDAAIPIKDNLFWFGDGVLNPGDWIFLYTGEGNHTTNDISGTNNKIYSLHWGKKATVLNNINVVPILIRVDAVRVYQELPLLPNNSKQSG